MKSVATISGIDEHGPMLQWTTHWVDLGAGTRLYCERDILTERTAREAAEAAVARMREGVAEMVGVMKREAQRRKAAGQHEAAAMLEDRANELRALLEGGA